MADQTFNSHGITVSTPNGDMVLIAGSNMRIKPAGNVVDISAQLPTNNFLSNITGLISGGTNVTITGNGTTASPYVISASGGGSGFTWNEITTASTGLAINNGYVMNNASRVIGTLPATAAFGSEIKISGKGAGGWQIAQNAGQTIHFDGNNTTTGTAGFLSSQSTFDCVSLLVITANTDFLVTTSIGNITGA